MIFTACALVAVKEGAVLAKGMDYNLFHQSILNQIGKVLRNHYSRNTKLSLLGDTYAEIRMNYPDNQSAIDDFIGWVKEISAYVISDNWRGEDVMGIFFNEFNRYKAKSENGQIFTPDHITSFMYRLIHCNQDDRLLDATCGSGAFLVKAMCNMIREAGGVNTQKAKEIKENQLYGIEWNREIFALACANMLIHKDGKTNLAQLDTRSDEACEWIRSKHITKVLMNPPYERKYGCMNIVQNVLDNVPAHTECAFILPDKKLEKDFADKRYGNKLLKYHTLRKIIKLPENVFFGVGVTTSIFIFESGVPQNGKTIQGFYIEDDGLETVKNQGRQDIKNRWQAIEDKWVRIIEDPLCPEAQTESAYIQSINPAEHLSFQMPEKPFEIYEEDFVKTMMDYEMFKCGIDVKEFSAALMQKVLYGSKVSSTSNNVSITIQASKLCNVAELPKYDKHIELRAREEWREFCIWQLFETQKYKKQYQVPTGASVNKSELEEGNIPRISVTGVNNGIVGWYQMQLNNPNYRIYKNFISVSFLGTVFYQKGQATLDMKVHCLKPLHHQLNDYTGVFLVCSILASLRDSTYADQISSTVLPYLTIKLPATSDGAPDWEYMEHYMQRIEAETQHRLELLTKV